jgi:transcriptional regulator with XRE-family HTH domain
MGSDTDQADRLKTQHIDLARGRRLRDLREAVGLVREQVGHGLDVAVTRIQDYEGGTRIPASRLWQFCGRYGVAVEDLFTGLSHLVGPPTPQPARNMAGLAEEGASFEGSADDEIVRAIEAAAAALNPVERRLASHSPERNERAQTQVALRA